MEKDQIFTVPELAKELNVKQREELNIEIEELHSLKENYFNILAKKTKVLNDYLIFF